MLFVAMLAGVLFAYVAVLRLAMTVVAPIRVAAAPPVAHDEIAAHSANQVLVQVVIEQRQLTWIVSGRKIHAFAELRQLLEAIAVADANASLTLDVAPDVPLGDAVDLYDAGREFGLENIEFAVGEP